MKHHYSLRIITQGYEVVSVPGRPTFPTPVDPRYLYLSYHNIRVDQGRSGSTRYLSTLASFYALQSFTLLYSCCYHRTSDIRQTDPSTYQVVAKKFQEVSSLATFNQVNYKPFFVMMGKVKTNLNKHTSSYLSS